MPQTQSQTPLWASKIAAFRKRLGMSQLAFAERLGTTQSNVSKWEKGTAYRPSPEQWMNLAKVAEGEIESLYFMEQAGVPTDFFMGKGSKQAIPTAIAEDAIRRATEQRGADLVAGGYLDQKSGSVRHIPLLRDAAAAGTPRAVDEDDIEELIAMPKKWVGGRGELYMIRIEGDSMSPILESGYIAIIDVSQRDPQLLERHMVLARVGDGVTVKWLRKNGDTYLLVPQHVSQRHEVQVVRPGETELLGAVVKWIGEPPPMKRK